MSNDNINISIEDYGIQVDLGNQDIEVSIDGAMNGGGGTIGPTGPTGPQGEDGATGPSGPGGTTVHSDLSNLEYENAGHTGFQKALTYEQYYKAYEID